MAVHVTEPLVVVQPARRRRSIRENRRDTPAYLPVSTMATTYEIPNSVMFASSKFDDVCCQGCARMKSQCLCQPHRLTCECKECYGEDTGSKGASSPESSQGDDEEKAGGGVSSDCAAGGAGHIGKRSTSRRVHERKDFADRGVCQFLPVVPRKLKGARSERRGKLIDASLARTRAEELGAQDASREKAREIAADLKDAGDDEEKVEVVTLREFPQAPAAFTYVEKHVSKVGVGFSLALLFAVLWLFWWPILFWSFRIIMVNLPSFGLIGLVCWWGRAMFMGGVLKMSKWAFTTVVIDNWAPVGAVDLSDHGDVRSDSAKAALPKYTTKSCLIHVRHRCVYTYRWLGLWYEQVVCDDIVVVSLSAYHHLMARQSNTLSDVVMLARMDSAAQSLQHVNLDPSQTHIVQDTLAFAFGAARFSRMHSQVDFQLAPGTHSSSTAIDSARCLSQRFRLRSEEPSLLLDIMLTTVKEYLLRPLWGLLLMAHQIPMATRTLFLILFGLWLSVLVVYHQYLMLIFGGGLAVLFIGGYAEISPRWIQLSNLTLESGSKIVRILKVERSNYVNSGLKLILALTIVIMCVNNSSSVLSRMNLILDTNTFEEFTPVLTSSSYVPDLSSSPLKLSYMNIPSSSNTFLSQNDPGMYLSGFIEAVRNTWRQITLPSSLISLENLWSSVSFNFIGTMRQITLTPEILLNTIAELRVALTNVNLNPLKSALMHVECLEKCALHWATALQTSWSSSSYAILSDLKIQIASLKEMIAWQEFQEQNINVAGLAEKISRMTRTTLSQLEETASANGLDVEFLRPYKKPVSTPVEPYSWLLSHFTSVLGLILKLSFILTLVGLGFAAWCSTRTRLLLSQLR